MLCGTQTTEYDTFGMFWYCKMVVVASPCLEMGRARAAVVSHICTRAAYFLSYPFSRFDLIFVPALINKPRDMAAAMNDFESISDSLQYQGIDS